MIESIHNKDKLVFKFSFTNPLFLEHELILNWKFSNKILITCFDLLKDERILMNLQRKGMTLKDYLYEKGFNKNVEIICDTGIFEFEAKKAKLNIDIPLYGSFSINDIFQAYQIIDPDYLVAPDEIILQSDTPGQIKAKQYKIIQNINQTLEIFPKNKIIPVLHGFSKETMEPYLDFLFSEKFQFIARGGLIPLWNESKLKFREVIKESEYLVRKKFSYLHSFGMPSLAVMKDYFHFNNYNSLDTSIIYYRTAQRRYLISRGYFISVRNAYFSKCGCAGCLSMQNNAYKPNSSDFVIGLYVHNCIMLSNLTYKVIDNPNVFQEPKFKKRLIFKEKLQAINNQSLYRSNLSFIPATNLLQNKNTVQSIFLPKIRKAPKKLPYKILVISSCSRKKAIKSNKILDLSELRTVNQRNKILDSNIEKLQAKYLYNSERINFLNKTLDDLKKTCEKADLFFLSAGFGLVSENEPLPAYDVSFTNKSFEEIIGRAKDLEIQRSIGLLPDKYDLIFLDLSPSYLQALLPLTKLLAKTKEIVIFHTPISKKDKIIYLDEKSLISQDRQQNYFPISLTTNTRVSILKNFYYFLAHQDILGKITTFKDWIEKIFTIESNLGYVLRVF